MGKRRSPVRFKNDIAKVEAALRPIVAERGGRMPTHPMLYALGHSGLSKAISKLGGLAAVGKIFGISTVGVKLRKGHYDDLENMRASLLPIVAELGGRMPTQSELHSRGQFGLSKAIGKHGGPAAVAKMLGISTAGVILSKGHYDDLENIRAVLLPIVAELGGRMPTHPELISRGLSGLSAAISKLKGPAAVAKMLGISAVGVRLRKGHYDDLKNLGVALLPIVAELGGRMPTQRELRSRGHSSLYIAIKKLGGSLAVATLLGLDPVTPSAIENRADKVARAYLALDLEDDGTALWEGMTTRWLTRDLDVALAAFEKDGTLDAFQRLLADP